MMEPIALTSTVAGKYKLTVYKRDGSVKKETEWFDNLITNQGLNLIGSTDNWLSACQVGTGTTPPTVNDTALATFRAGTASGSTTFSRTSTPPYYAFARRTWRFNPGQATGNITEVGVGTTATVGNLLSRALVTNDVGTPVTITVLADEYLDVTYEFRYYAPVDDVVGSFQIAGDTYDWISRAANVTTTAWSTSTTGTSSAIITTTTGWFSAWSGPIGTVTSMPSGTQAAATTSNVVTSAYSNNSYERQGSITWTPAQANFAGGVRSFSVRFGVGLYQFEVTPPIMKTATDTLSMTFRHSWARKTL